MSWQATEWALTVAPFPKSDPTARLVLAYLATHAHKDGRNAYPLVSTIARSLDLNADVVSRVLKRLVAYGLISKDGIGPQGQARWSLHLDRERSADAINEADRRRRKLAAERKARYRAKNRVHDSKSGTVHDRKSGTDATVHDRKSETASSVHDRESWTVHDSKSGTGVDVHDSESGTGVDVHDSESGCPRSRVGLSTTNSRDVHDSKYPQNRPMNRPLNRQENRPPEPPLLDLPASKTSRKRKPDDTYTAAFESAWAAYGRKGAKRAAAIEWHRAVERANPIVIAAAIGPYVASTPEIKFRKDFERWLKNDGWESAVVASRSGHQAYRNPDPSAYDEDL